MRAITNFFHLSSLILPLALLLSACNVPADLPTPLLSATLPGPAQEPASPTAVPTDAAPAQTTAPTQIPAPSEEQDAPSVTIDVSSVAQDFTSLAVAAVPPNSEGPWWEAMPQYTLITLQGYPIADHLLQAQIFIYPLAELSVNEAAGKVAQSLRALLQDQQAGKSLPYLPLYNAAQVMHAQLQTLDFKNGQGLRFLTQYDQGILPINNHELLYTYQGLTSDGKYYLAAVLPVNLSGLPANENVTTDLPADFSNDFPAYLAGTVDCSTSSPPALLPPI